jgi:hypothetical protein
LPILEILIFLEERPLPHLSQREKELEFLGKLIRLTNAALDLSGKWRRKEGLGLRRGRDDIACHLLGQSH